jgi:hypothetical protein
MHSIICVYRIARGPLTGFWRLLRGLWRDDALLIAALYLAGERSVGESGALCGRWNDHQAARRIIY